MYAYDPMIDLLVLDEMNKLPDEKETKCHSICRRCVLKDCELQMLYNILRLTYPVSLKLEICSIFTKYSDVMLRPFVKSCLHKYAIYIECLH